MQRSSSHDGAGLQRQLFWRHGVRSKQQLDMPYCSSQPVTLFLCRVCYCTSDFHKCESIGNRAGENWLVPEANVSRRAMDCCKATTDRPHGLCAQTAFGNVIIQNYTAGLCETTGGPVRNIPLHLACLVLILPDRLAVRSGTPISSIRATLARTGMKPAP